MRSQGAPLPTTVPPAGTTLRQQLLKLLLVPIVAVLVCSSIVSYFFAVNYAALAYDNALLDSAQDISRQTRYVNGELKVDIPRAALDMLESGNEDRVFYLVRDARGKVIAGHVGIPSPAVNPAAGKAVFHDSDYNGDQVRIATLLTEAPGTPEQAAIWVQVAETLNKRHALTNQILLTMLLPSLLIIVVATALVWFGVQRGTKPLATLQREIASRSHRDLSPLPDTSAPSDIRSLAHAVNDLMTRLSTALASQQRFVADAAHQLRTPLAGLKTQAEFALRQDDRDELKGTLHRIKSATEQTTHLINQLLTLARAEPGGVRQQAVQSLDMAELLRLTTADWVPRALERHIDLGYENTGGPATIEGNPFLIREMLGNLIDNAIRYTQCGGRVTARILTEARRVIICIEDNGPGIPEAERERVFERFHRMLGSGTDGCGLGLAIVREIALNHDAMVRIDSASGGHGALVSVTFGRAAAVKQTDNVMMEG